MTDVYGRIVLQTTLANGERRLDVGHLAVGTYWVRVTHNGRTSVAQCVLQK
jgi:hypothetical protein